MNLTLAGLGMEGLRWPPAEKRWGLRDKQAVSWESWPTGTNGGWRGQGQGPEVWVGQKRASGVGARACLGHPRGSASPLADPQQALGPEDCPYQPLLGTIKKGYGALRTASRHEFEGPTLREPNMV